LSEFVGGEVDEIARAYYAAAACFSVRERFREIEALACEDEAKLDMLQEFVQLARRATRWLLRHRRANLDVAALSAHFKPRIESLVVHTTGLMGEAGARRRRTQIDARVARGVPADVAAATANAAALAVMLPVIDAAERARLDLGFVARTFAEMNQSLGFDWLAEQLMALPAGGLWPAMERDAMVDELVTHHAMLAAIACRAAGTACSDAVAAVAAWTAREAGLMSGWRAAIESAKQASSRDFALYSVTLRKLGDVARALAGAAESANVAMS
jgi:glutamate dehydrogenase